MPSCTIVRRNNYRNKYDDVFKNIPKLFQHFVEVLNEKPDLLERNDVTVFKRDVNQTDTSISNRANDNMDSDGEKHLDNSMEGEGKSDKTFFIKDKFQVDVSDDFYEYVGNPGEENYTGQSSSTPTNGEFVDDLFLGTLGSSSFELTPEEISSNSVLVEQMLEDNNSSRK